MRSPYTVGGKQRLFAEPPHMQASMLFIPAGATVPAVGDEIDCRVRFTATSLRRGRDQLTVDAGRAPERPFGHSVREPTGSCSGRRTSRTTTATR